MWTKKLANFFGIVDKTPQDNVKKSQCPKNNENFQRYRPVESRPTENFFPVVAALSKSICSHAPGDKQIMENMSYRDIDDSLLSLSNPTSPYISYVVDNWPDIWNSKKNIWSLHTQIIPHKTSFLNNFILILEVIWTNVSQTLTI